jgi:alpha-glucosidase
MFRPSHLNLTLLQAVTLTCTLASAALAQTPPPRPIPPRPPGPYEIIRNKGALEDARLASPHAGWTLTFRSDANHQLIYSIVDHQGRSIIQPSALRLNLKDQSPLGAHVIIYKATPGAHDTTYHRISGKASTIRDQYNSLLVEAVDATAKWPLNIEARAYDDAVAFRYVIPEPSPTISIRVVDEHTEFRFPRDPNLFTLFLPNFTSSYESEFIKSTASALASTGGGSEPRLAGLPLLAEIPGVAWIAITEADLKGNSAMYLTNTGSAWGDQVLVSRLAPNIDEPGIAVTGTLPYHSAWRIIQIADTPAKLIESNIVSNLSPESAIADTSWIKPGKASWDWWSGSLGPDGKPSFSTATMKYYVDFAAQSGFEYMLIDAGWSPRDDITKMNGKVDIPDVVQYARRKNVGVWIWAHSKAVEKQMDEAFPLYEKWGVAGVKTDFIERDDQHGIEFYYRSAEAAAKHHLMIDYHGATKPTGIERMWPNIMGYEAVMGLEYNKGNARENPVHEVTLPFTRMLAGPMDYTPGAFNNVTDAEFEQRRISPMVRGTRAHQLAMYAIYEAAFQMVSDSPAAYKDQPAFEFIRHAPAAWDETRAINGMPAEYITLARRKGKEWFLGSMTNWTPRDLDIPLAFLGPGKYRAEIFADADDAAKYPKNTSIRKETVDSGTHLKAHMAPGGGYAVRLVPVP